MIVKYGVMELLRRVIGVLKVGDGKGNLERYLGGKVRSEFLAGVKMEKILGSLVQKAYPRDPEIFKEDLVDMFIDQDGGDKLVGLLLSHAEEDLSEEDAEKVIKGGVLNEELRKKVKELAKKFEGLVVEYLYRYMNNLMLKWKEEHKDEVSDEKLEEEGKEIGVLDEKQVEEEMKDQYAWEEGLIKDVIHLINTKVPEGKRKLYKVILKDKFLGGRGVSNVSIAKGVGVTEDMVDRGVKDFGKILREFLVAQGLGPKFDVGEREIEVPLYSEFLKEEEDIADLKEYLKDRMKDTVSEKTREVLNLLAEGKGIGEIAERTGIQKQVVQNTKSRYFSDNYSEWYKDRVKEIRKAYMRIESAIKQVPYEVVKEEEKVKKPEVKHVRKDPKIPYEVVKKDEESLSGEVGKMHDKMMDQALDHHRTRVTVSFEADFDHMSMPSEVRKLDESDSKKDPHFKWLTYEVTVNEERRGPERKDGSRKTLTIDYVYHRKLKGDGEFDGEGRSTLKIDGEVVRHDNRLLARIDEHIEKGVVTEGVIPHGMFPVAYVNTKTGKEYIGTRDFKRSFDGLFVPDEKHKERVKEEERFKEKKRLGPQIGVTERAKAEKLLSTLERELKTEKGLGIRRKQEIREHINQVKLWLKTKHVDEGEGYDEIEEIMKQEKLIRHPEQVEQTKTKTEEVPTEKSAMVLKYAVVMPGVKGEGAKKLIGILEGYGISRTPEKPGQTGPAKVTGFPNPRMWLEPKDLVVLARTLRVMSEKKFEENTKERPKGMKKEDWEQTVEDARKGYKRDLEDAEKLFPELIKDLKVRKDEFVRTAPGDYKLLAGKKDMTWVDDKGKVDEVETKINRELHAEIKAPEKPEKAINILEQSKYKALEGLLEANQKGFDALAKRVHEAGLKPLKVTDEAVKSEHAKLQGVVTELNTEFKKTVSYFLELKEKKQEEEKKEKELSEEEITRMKELLSKIPELRSDMLAVKDTIEQLEVVPALGAAKAMKAYLTYFSSLYNYLASLLWFRMREAELIVEADVKEGDVSHLRDQVVTIAGDLARTDLKAKDNMKSLMGKLRGVLNKFIDGLGELKAQYKMVEYKTAEEKSYEEALKRYVIPEDLTEEVRGLIKKVKAKNPKEGLIAEEEFKKISDNIVAAYRAGIPIEKMEEMARKKKITVPAAAVKLKKHQEALGRAAIDKFILDWQGIVEKGMPKDRSPLGNKPHGEYDRMGEYVETHISELFTLTPPDTEEKLPSAGIPTPKDIREAIEENFGREPEPTTKELRQWYKAEAADFHFGGGGGGKSKGFAKVIKPPIAQGTWEEVKGGVKELLKKDPEHIVLVVMATYAQRVRKAVKEAKEDGGYIEVGDVIDGFVYLLKQFYSTLIAMKAHPSSEQFKLPPPGAPKFTGVPDLPIDDYAEAEKLFNKMREIYEVINSYIKPDHVGVPPESLKNISPGAIKNKRYLPYGLGEWMEWFAEKGGKHGPVPGKKEYPESEAEKNKDTGPGGKKPDMPSHTGRPASASEGLYDFHSQMSFNVAAKFASMGEVMIDELETALQ